MIAEEQEVRSPENTAAPNRRTSPRSVVVRHVWVQGRDARFGRFEQDAFTLEISERGLRLGGIYRNCLPGSTMAVSAHGRTATYQVIWMAPRDSPYEGQCGLLRTDASEPLFPELEHAAAEPALLRAPHAGEIVARTLEWFTQHESMTREEFARMHSAVVAERRMPDAG